MNRARSSDAECRYVMRECAASNCLGVIREKKELDTGTCTYRRSLKYAQSLSSSSKEFRLIVIDG